MACACADELCSSRIHVSKCVPACLFIRAIHLAPLHLFSLDFTIFWYVTGVDQADVGAANPVWKPLKPGVKQLVKPAACS